MSEPAPWNYDGATQSQPNAGNVKLFNPAEFSAPTVTTSSHGYVNQDQSTAATTTANGFDQTQNQGGQWDWNPQQWNNNYPGSNQQDYSGHATQSHFNEGQGQTMENNMNNAGHMFQGQQQVSDPSQHVHQQVGDNNQQQQYWNNVDPNQQNWQHGWQNQQQFSQYNYQEQNWGNAGNMVQQQYQNDTSQTVPVSGAENYHQVDGQVQHHNYYNHDGQGQGYNIQGQGYGNQVQPVVSEALDSSVASTDASESLNQSLPDQEHGSSGFHGQENQAGFFSMEQNAAGQTTNEIQHSSENIQTNPNVGSFSVHSNQNIPVGNTHDIEGTANQFSNIALADPVDIAPDSGVRNVDLVETEVTNNQNQSAAKGQGSSVIESTPDASPPSSEDTQGLSDWEVVPPQTLNVPTGIHSRQSSSDNNVQFFIGSSRNSPSMGTGSPASSVQGQGSEEGQSGVAAEIKEQASFLSPPVGPKFLSSPNIEPATSASQDNTVTGPPPPAMPPSGMNTGADNPFRKSAPRPNLQTAPLPAIPDETKSSSQENVSPFDQQSTGINVSSVFTGNESKIEPVSPILSAEETGRSRSSSHSTPKPQPQSPIMPRKESPFQPPQRKRNTSGSSETIEENTKLESDDGNRDGSRYKMTSHDFNRSISGDSRRSSGSDSHENSQDYNKGRKHRDREREKYSRSKPPPGPSSRSMGVLSPRRMERVLQQNQAQRAKHNMSPATTLWAESGVLASSSVILAPAAPMPAIVPQTTGPEDSSLPASHKPQTEQRGTHDVLHPVENLISSLTEHISKESTPEQEHGYTQQVNPSVRQAPQEMKRDTSGKERHERNSSIDRELEICRKQEEVESVRDSRYREKEPEPGEHYSQRDKYRDSRQNDQRDPNYRDPRDPNYRDPRDPNNRDPRDRENIRDSRDPRQDEYNAYYNRRGRDNRGGPAPAQRDPYKEPYYGDERYDRPRSRNSMLEEDQTRSSSRQGHERPRSRQDYRNDGYYRDRYGRTAYDYDYYNRHGYYYNDRYYDQSYYGDPNRYARGYVDEYYQGQYNAEFNRLLDYNYYGSQGDYYSPGYDDDRYSQNSQSRVQTPGSLSDLGEQHDPYGYGHGSRSSSRVGYDDYRRAQYDPYYYNQGYYSQQDPYQQEEPKTGRMTPAKYSIPHLRACFGPGGQLIKVLPNRPTEGQPATVEIHEVDELLQENLETEELKGFPGPLIRGDTHKNDVLAFCQRKAKACTENFSMTDRESAELLWKLLELLIKQNGTVMGTDISDLLLEGHEPTTLEYSMMGMRISQSMDNLDEEPDESVDVSTVSNVTADRSMVSKLRSREEVTDRFRHLLLYGRKKDALDWAMKKNLWGHALFLASKMDNRTHANVMTRFANNAMKMNDPLQTLYQLMSGRQPASVSSIADDKWGDWRPHLAMILSNHSHKPDMDRKSIMTLGDTLASKGFLHASQFCYLMAQVNFGSYHKKTSKLVLIGSNHSLPLAEFATNEAIQCTEIYEYAMSLGSAAFFLINFQYFKFLYACRLAENGFPQEALHYCDVISRYIQRSPTMFQPTLVKLVYNLADRLKHFDPQRLHMEEDAEDPFWLQQLKRISQGFEDGSLRPISGSVTPMGYGGITRASSDSGEVANYTQSGTADQMTAVANQNQLMYSQDSYYQQQQAYGQGTDQSQVVADASQFKGDQSHYNSGQTQEGAVYGNQQGYDYNYQQAAGQQQEQQAYAAGQNYGQQTAQQYDSQSATQTNQGEAQTTGTANQYPAQTTDTTNQYQGYTGAVDYSQYSNYTAQQDPNQGGAVEQSQTPMTSHQQDYSNYGNQRIKNRGSMSTASSLDTEDETDPESSLGASHNSGAGGGFDYFTAATQRPIVAPKIRKRTASETSNTSGGGQQRPQQSTSMPPPKAPAKSSEKQSGKGFLGGFISRFMPKGKNEIILPSDKNPSIVWDDANKKWINSDNPEEEEIQAPPPPKDTDIPRTSMPAATAASSGPAIPGATDAGPPTFGNKFAKPKGRGARAQYVDVLNPQKTTTTVPNNLFNVMPTSQSSPAIFSPGGKSDTQEAEKTDTQVPPASALPPSVQENSGEAQQESIPKEPPGHPMMFNPSQFSAGQPVTTVPSTGGPRKYGQRRVYPK